VDPHAPKASSAKIGATIDLDRLRQIGMLSADSPRSRFAEEFRNIKRPLLRHAGEAAQVTGRSANLIVVTSALPGEGKTFCALNLALSVAMEMQHSVLLVDADVARPAIFRLLGLPPAPGLMDALLQATPPLSELILHTNIANLSLLPAGRPHPRATELLASDAMGHLLGQLAGADPARLIIFDSPPLLLTSEASVLAEQMGQVLLVVESECSTRRDVQEAVRRLAHCARVDLVYNKASAFTGDNIDGYYG
jgi:protein-tyrosine kinase